MPVSEEIQRAFDSGATILTANVRAARWLQREHAVQQRSAGLRAWSTPAIHDWETWLWDLWQVQALAVADAPLLLTSVQERSVWMRMQRDDAALLVSPTSMAALAEGAYALLSDYEAQTERSHAWGKTDAERFRQWAASFDRECMRQNWMPRAGLETKVAVSLKTMTLPDEILLLGFDRTTPAQDSLLHALTNSGVRVQFAYGVVADSQTEFVRSAGMRDEITACAWWARELLEGNPDARIGVLVPDLSAARSEMERIFRRVLMPQSDNVVAAQAMPFEFSLGQPLAHVPVIRAVLLLLRWLHASLGEEEVSWLLLSGFLLSSDADYLVVAGLDAKRRGKTLLSSEMTLAGFLKRSELFHSGAIEKLENAQRAAAANRMEDAERLPGRWADLVLLLLREAGWPGAANRDTLHFQALRRWERALDEIALLDFDGRRMRFGDFLRALEAHALETIFSPESQGAPVQIMGALEASGQQFDAVWFLGVDDESWPLRGRPHPLLANEVQRRHKMPYSDPESDLELARTVTARIAASAPVVFFSHAERNEDGELRPSPLLPANAEWRSAPYARMEHEAQELETLEDASEVVAWPIDRSPGGSEILKHQAACAFQAFAMKRLHAEPLSRNEWGLSPAERGVLLHKTLEKVWSPPHGALHSLDDLQSAMREGRLGEILTTAIADVFARFEPVVDTWMRAYLASEQRRLHVRLEEWMRIEAARVPFKVIACEQKLGDVNVGGLNLRLRADRIDELGGGDRLLIDYKSGEVSPRDWQPPRPNEPQLPLYAVFGNVDDVRGVLFAQIRAGKTGFSGSVTDVRSQLFADAKGNSSLAKEPYSETMRDAWQDALLMLAEDFLRGEAAVDPKERKTCEQCPLPGLCRVAEMRNPLEEGVDLEGSEGDA